MFSARIALSRSPFAPLLLSLAGALGPLGCDDASSPRAVDAAIDPAAGSAADGGGSASASQRDAAPPTESSVDAASQATDAGAPAAAPTADAAPSGPLAPADAGALHQDAASSLPKPRECPPCADGTVCDPAAGACVDQGAPWQLDCSELPSDGTCEGGPREVLLATSAGGLTLMLDPQDGHFLGYLKRQSQRDTSSGGYVQITQGPDQCLWSVNDGYPSDGLARAVERWNTDGSFRDDIIPRGKFKRGERDRLAHARALAFTPDRVYVGSDTGVSRYKLDGSFDAEVLPDVEAEALLAFADGTLITTGSAVQRWLPGSTEPLPVLTEPTEQLWYIGGGALLTIARSEALMYRVDIGSGVASETATADAAYLKYGFAPLGNGSWLIASTARDPFVRDPLLALPEGSKLVEIPKNPAIDLDYGLRMVGRACLPSRVVDAVTVAEPPVASCDEPAGPTLYAEDFETGDFRGSGITRSFNGWTETTSYLPRSEIDGTTAARGMRSLRVSPKAEERYESGVRHTFDNLKPSYIGYWVKFDPAQQGWAAFQTSGSESSHETITIHADGLSTYESDVAGATNPDTWVRVQLRDIDWERGTYDLYVDCERLADDILLDPEAGRSLTEIDLFVGLENTNELPAFFDDIVIK
jgi:hypothetical protein